MARGSRVMAARTGRTASASSRNRPSTRSHASRKGPSTPLGPAPFTTSRGKGKGGQTQRVDEVPGEAEGNALGDGEEEAGLEAQAEVNVDDLNHEPPNAGDELAMPTSPLGQ